MGQGLYIVPVSGNEVHIFELRDKLSTDISTIDIEEAMR